MGMASLHLLPNVFLFFALDCLVIKNKMGVSIEAFSPFSSCKLQKHGRIVILGMFCDSLRFGLLFSFDSPEFFCESFLSGTL